MCPFCGNVRHAPIQLDSRPLSELHLTEAEYTEYKSHSVSDTTYKSLVRKDSPKLRVVGYSDDTQAFLRQFDPQEESYIEVPWSDMDSVKWIAQRIEDIIRVSLHHWYLATADGVVFRTFGELVMSSAAFRVQDQVVLTLLMPTDLAEYADSHLKQHGWKQTAPGTPSAAGTDLAKCVAKFHLIDPKPSDAWGAYLAQRDAADTRLVGDLGAYAGEDRPHIYDKIENALEDAFADTDLDDEAEAVLHDCVVPLLADLADDGWGNVADAEVLSRIYSPTNPAAVDVYLAYHYRTRYASVEFSCNVYYRVHAAIRGAALAVARPRGPRQMNGFRPLFEMGLADVPPGKRWRAVDERSFGVSVAQAGALHRVLFGDAGVGAQIAVRETLVLLLASVGIAFSAEEDRYTMGAVRWEGLDGSARWLGRNLRRVAAAAGELVKADGEDSNKEDDEGDDDSEDEWEDEDDEDEDEAEDEDGDEDDEHDDDEEDRWAGPDCRYQ
ncbi:hypothetical protein B0H15DRAFT_944146 [Mycena belliarum]|uniref:Uncharacterized protein n=1 Tax=Mycena belliarum TaxID=1033014 RepID=A0AAD6UEK7_9AGAR|nr:hypothetical protein B0H15DRAFT_944146 [Mycena belliae]